MKKIFGEVLFELMKIYVFFLFFLIKEKKIKGVVYIIGGGFVENILWMLLEFMVVEIKFGIWLIFLIFGCL